jgi:hypothetical protein
MREACRRRKEPEPLFQGAFFCSWVAYPEHERRVFARLVHLDQPAHNQGKMSCAPPGQLPLQRGQSALQRLADKPSLLIGDCIEGLDGLRRRADVELHCSAGAVDAGWPSRRLRGRLRRPARKTRSLGDRANKLCGNVARLATRLRREAGNGSLSRGGLRRNAQCLSREDIRLARPSLLNRSPASTTRSAAPCSNTSSRPTPTRWGDLDVRGRGGFTAALTRPGLEVAH